MVAVSDALWIFFFVLVKPILLQICLLSVLPRYNVIIDISFNVPDIRTIAWQLCSLNIEILL